MKFKKIIKIILFIFLIFLLFKFKYLFSIKPTKINILNENEKEFADSLNSDQKKIFEKLVINGELRKKEKSNDTKNDLIQNNKNTNNQKNEDNDNDVKKELINSYFSYLTAKEGFKYNNESNFKENEHFNKDDKFNKLELIE